MHPEIAKALVVENQEKLRRLAAESRRGPVRRSPSRFSSRIPGWRVSWSRTVLSADATHRRGSSLVIIISARRPVRRPA
jgi:hypothetical protein